MIDHNSQNYRELIKSVQSQRYSNLEVIFVSNRLNTRDQIVVDFLALKDDLNRCKHLSLINRSCKASLYNIGITCATGDYIWCIDENVSLESEWSITKIVDKLGKAKTHVVHLEEEDHDAKQNSSNYVETGNNVIHEDPSKLISRKDWNNPNRFIFHTEIIRLFDINFVEGWSHVNGAFTALQIMRCAANIYFFKPENVEFKKDKLKQNERELIEHMLSSNYVLRYSEITFATIQTSLNCY